MGVSAARRRSALLTVAALFTMAQRFVTWFVSGDYGGVLIVGLALAVATLILSVWASATHGRMLFKAVNGLFTIVALGVCADAFRRMVERFGSPGRWALHARLEHCTPRA